ncbi:MAG: RidA family protein [Chloroflexi bacterium]|nr:RidA family protein [Chloroflexota bacterium]
MQKEVILTPGTDPQKMVFSPGIRAGQWLFPSGSAGLTKDGKVAGPDIESQARQALKNLGEVLEQAGSSWGQVVKVNCYLTHPQRDFAGWNTVFKEFFPKNPPARTTVGTSELIGPDWLIEVELVAVI